MHICAHDMVVLGGGHRALERGGGDPGQGKGVHVHVCAQGVLGDGHESLETGCGDPGQKEGVHVHICICMVWVSWVVGVGP